MQKGNFIVFDGPNGVGKTTIIDSVSEHFKKNNVSYVRTKEPSVSELGTYIRSNQNKYSREVLACLVAANRYEHLELTIKPSIEAGSLVLCDRYVPSSLVYQLMDGLDSSFVLALNQKASIPDLTIFLTADEKAIVDRLKLRNQLTRFEKDTAREVSLYNSALSLFNRKGWKTLSIDTTNRSVQDITEEIVTTILKITQP